MAERRVPAGAPVDTRNPKRLRDDTPPEVWDMILRKVGCQGGIVDEPKRTCHMFMELCEDSMACSCNPYELVRRVLLSSDRRALVHVLRYHRDTIPKDLLVELCLAVGDLTCPPVGVSCMGDARNATGATPGCDNGRALLQEACKEGKLTVIRQLLAQGVTPDLNTVLEACRRLEVRESGALDAILECGASVCSTKGNQVTMGIYAEMERAATQNSFGEYDGHESVVDPAGAVSRILSGSQLPMAMEQNGMSKAFVYLLKMDIRFARITYNFKRAFMTCIKTRDSDAARVLFEECNMQNEWISREHIILLTQTPGCREIMLMALKRAPRLILDAVHRSVCTAYSDTASAAIESLPVDCTQATLNFLLGCAHTNADTRALTVLCSLRYTRASVPISTLLIAMRQGNADVACQLLASYETHGVPAWFSSGAGMLIQSACAAGLHAPLYHLVKLTQGGAYTFNAHDIIRIARHCRVYQGIDTVEVIRSAALQ